MTLPPCPARFTAKKAAILAHLAEPEDQYTDASPKGAVDEGVRPLLEAINCIDGFVSTSSCAGRVAVFFEGRRSGGGGEAEAHEGADRLTTASAGGKGGGGSWLFVSHEPLLGKEGSSYADTDWAAVFGLEAAEDDSSPASASQDGQDGQDEQRLVHFKFEPMILHVATASLAHAQLLLSCALAAGFRESGAVSLEPPSTKPGAAATAGEDSAGPMPVVAVRCMGLGLASVVGVGRDEGAGAQCIVSPGYLARLARVADQRFALNRERTERFRLALAAAMDKEQQRQQHEQAAGSSKPGWEDAAARRARLRAEGLERQAALQREKREAAAAEGLGAK